MIDFTNCPRTNKGYNGANGEKISVIYNGERYMLKFSSVPKINKDMNYTNACRNISRAENCIRHGIDRYCCRE